MLTYIVDVSILFLRKENDMVDKREKLMNSFNQYGFLTFKQVIDENLHYKTLLTMVAEGKIVAEEKGLYRLPDIYLDEWFVLQYRFPKGIFSLETALWLHGLSLTIPFNMTMSFPYGTNTKNIKEADICPIILRSHYSEGIIEIERLPGQFIKVYEVERVLVECLRPVHQVDLQIIAPAFKKYFQQNKIHLHKLFYYAQLFKVTDKLQSYTEVLS